jgi:uncharacterized protein (DUF952 family)
MIFHITDDDTWAQSQAQGAHTGSTRGADLAEVGFIHCSDHDQWPTVMLAFYADAGPLLLLHIDTDHLTSPYVYEDVPGAASPFPHIYGPLNLDAVVAVERLANDNATARAD